MENKFGSNLRLLRKKQKLTLENLGEKLKISKSAISDYEIGKTSPPLDVCELICDFFKINIDDFKNISFADLSAAAIEKLQTSKKHNNEPSEDFSNEKKQLEFHNKLLSQQIEGLQIQLQLIKQIVGSKDSEIKSLQIQVKLLDEKLNN